MGLYDEARSSVVRLPGPKCSVQVEMLRHADLADDIAAVIRDHSITCAHADTTFERHGIDISANTISRHRTGKCITCRQAGVTW